MSSHIERNRPAGMSGWRTTLWARPTRAPRGYPDKRMKIELARRILPEASVVEKKSSSAA